MLKTLAKLAAGVAVAAVLWALTGNGASFALGMAVPFFVHLLTSPID